MSIYETVPQPIIADLLRSGTLPFVNVLFLFFPIACMCVCVCRTEGSVGEIIKRGECDRRIDSWWIKDLTAFRPPQLGPPKMLICCV